MKNSEENYVSTTTTKENVMNNEKLSKLEIAVEIIEKLNSVTPYRLAVIISKVVNYEFAAQIIYNAVKKNKIVSFTKNDKIMIDAEHAIEYLKMQVDSTSSTNSNSVREMMKLLD